MVRVILYLWIQELVAKEDLDLEFKKLEFQSWPG